MGYHGMDDTVLIESDLVPGGFIVYYADGDEEILHANQFLIDLLECDSFEDFMEVTGGSFRGLMSLSDRGATEDSILAQVRERNGYDHVYYQIRTKSGRSVSVDDYGRLVEREGERPRFYVFITEADKHGGSDWLTGLPVMAHFKYVADLELRSLTRRGERMALVVFDVMGMRMYNAIHGRDGGDGLLCTLADVLRKHFGSEASCRFAGDSFCVFSAFAGIHQRIAATFADFATSEVGAATPLMAGAHVVDPDEDISDALDHARSASNADGTTWESHVLWYSEQMHASELLRIHILEHLDEAMEKGWIRPFYQGIVRSASGAICTLEALARWVDPTYGMLVPDDFVPILAEAGMLPKLDLHILDCVLADLVHQREHDLPVVPVSLNFSMLGLDSNDYAHEIIKRTEAAGVPATQLRIETVDPVASSEPDILRKQMRVLRESGFEVWLDDFGTSHSSLSALGEFDFDLIKLDAGFLARDSLGRSAVVVDGVVRAAKRMGVRTLAEDVETREYAERLANLGCDMLQGFFLDPPHEMGEIDPHIARDVARIALESNDESTYWDAVSSVSLTDFASNSEGKGVSETSMSSFPVGVLERREQQWHVLRFNETMKEMLVEGGVMPAGASVLDVSHIAVEFDEIFLSAVDRCDSSKSWERIGGPLESGAGFQCYVSPLATCERAHAYLVTSVPTMLGNALGTYGDVPVGYAVMRVIRNKRGNGAADIEYIYANELYRRWGGLGASDYTGRRLLDIAGAGALRWLEPCYRAAVLGESSHDVYYSPESGHWLSYNIMGSPIRDHCVFAFTIADAEQMERAELISDRDTAERIIGITNALNDELGYEAAMNGLLEAISKVIHPDRLYIYERGPKTTSNTFEWCAPGIEPQKDTLQKIDNDEFIIWDELRKRDSVVFIPDVSALKRIDMRLYQQLKRQGVDRVLAAPFFERGRLIGYLGADNYALEEGLDTRRVLSTVSTFVSAHIANRRLMQELERTGTHDALTGLLNRRGIDEELGARLEAGVDEPFVLALLDIDDFKTINDLYGHDVGDEALRVMAQILHESFSDDAIIGRNGGDEALIAVFGDETGRIDELLEEITGKEMRFSLGGREYGLTLSAGYAWCPRGSDDLKPVYSQADEALYAVKLAGKSAYRAWSPQLAESTNRTMLGFSTRDLADAMPVAICAHGLDGTLLFANDWLAELLGYDNPHELMSGAKEGIWSFVHPDDAAMLRSELARVDDASTDPGLLLRLGLRVSTVEGDVLEVTYRARWEESGDLGRVLYAYLVEASA